MNLRNTLIIALTELKMSAREIIPFSLILIMPVLMVFMMGNIMKPTFEAIENKVEPFSVLYLNEDKGPVSTAINELVNLQSNEYFNLVSAQGVNIEEEVLKGKYPAAILIDEKGSITVIGSGKDPLEEGIVRGYIDSYIMWMNTQTAITLVASNSHSMRAVIQTHGHSFVNEQSISKQIFKNLTSFQFFAASMMVFFLLTSGMGIGNSLIEGRINKTFKRINSFPIEKRDYLIGKIVASILIGMIQALLIILITTIAFNVDWGTNPLALGLISIVIVFISCAIGIIFSSFFSNSGALTAVMTIVLWFMAFVSGGFTGTPILEFASKLTINHWAFHGITTLMTGGAFKDVAGNILILVVIAVGLWTLGLILYNRRVSHE